jgi:hypothetical protein
MKNITLSIVIENDPDGYSVSLPCKAATARATPTRKPSRTLKTPSASISKTAWPMVRKSGKFRLACRQSKSAILKVLKSMLRDAGLKPEDFDLINSAFHQTGPVDAFASNSSFDIAPATN